MPFPDREHGAKDSEIYTSDVNTQLREFYEAEVNPNDRLRLFNTDFYREQFFLHWLGVRLVNPNKAVVGKEGVLEVIDRKNNNGRIVGINIIYETSHEGIYSVIEYLPLHGDKKPQLASVFYRAYTEKLGSALNGRYLQSLGR